MWMTIANEWMIWVQNQTIYVTPILLPPAFPILYVPTIQWQLANHYHVIHKCIDGFTDRCRLCFLLCIMLIHTNLNKSILSDRTRFIRSAIYHKFERVPNVKWNTAAAYIKIFTYLFALHWIETHLFIYSLREDIVIGRPVLTGQCMVEIESVTNL